MSIIRPLSMFLFGAAACLTLPLQAQSGGAFPPADPARGGQANTTCEGAVINDLAVGAPVTVTGDNTDAVLDPNLGVPVVWEAFTTTACADVSVAYCGTTPAFVNAQITLVVGCPMTNFVFNSAGNIDTEACGDGNYTILFPNLPAGTYYYPVQQGGGSMGAYTLTFTAAACSATPPANAVCAGAIELPSAAECTPVSGNVAFATAAGNTGLGCGNGDVADGVWYTFEATSEAHDLTVAPSAQFNAHVEVFSGTCGALTSVACGVGSNFGLSALVRLRDLTIGETYYIRVNDWYSGSPVSTGFFICLQTVTITDCDADAGAVTPGAATVCLVNGQATITATPSGSAVVPDGFQTLYFLSSGGVIVQGASTPLFVVSGTGTYAVHTLVYDNATLDLNGLVFGGTTMAFIDSRLIQGGGAICGALDMAGATTVVQECEPCAAHAGNFQAGSGTVCLSNGTAMVDATHGAAPSVPEGFSTIYLLTSGQDLVIRQATFTTPSFEVTTVGLYTIHTLVYNAATLDLNELTFNVTTALDVNALLLQGGGSICGSLDLLGAPVTVDDCTGIADHRAGAWSIWPSPNGGSFNLANPSVGGATIIQVIGPDGRLVHEQRATTQPDAAVAIALPGTPAAGAYVVRAITAEGVAVMRMVVE